MGDGLQPHRVSSSHSRGFGKCLWAVASNQCDLLKSRLIAYIWEEPWHRGYWSKRRMLYREMGGSLEREELMTQENAVTDLDVFPNGTWPLSVVREDQTSPPRLPWFVSFSCPFTGVSLPSRLHVITATARTYTILILTVHHSTKRSDWQDSMSVLSRIMTPQRCPCPNPQNLERVDNPRSPVGFADAVENLRWWQHCKATATFCKFFSFRG